MNLFKSSSEKLTARLADLEGQIGSLAKRAEEGRIAEAEAQDKLVQDLAEGLPVDDWRKKREAAEKKAAEAERDLRAAQDAAELVRAKLEQAQAAELLESLKERYAAAERRAPAVVEEFRQAGRTFSRALGRLEGLRRDEDSTLVALRAAGEKDIQLFGIPLPDNILAAELVGPEDGRKLMTVTLSTWPSAGPSS